MTKRKNHAPEFKAKIALEAIRKEMTIAELSKKFGLQATRISAWKRAATANMASAFGRRGHDPDTPGTADIETLHSKIERLVVERDFLGDASVRLLGCGAKNDEQGSQAEPSSAVCVAHAGAVQPFPRAEGRERREPEVHGNLNRPAFTGG
jgi:transposase